MSEENVVTEISMPQARQVAGAGLIRQPIAEELKNKVVCRHGHILGVAIREKARSGSKSVTRFLVFRGALMPHMQVPGNIAFAKMDEGSVICGICGDEKKWFKQKGE